MRVSLFITCLADAMYPQVGESIVRILHRYGCALDFPQNQTCCGQPAFNSGYRDEAREVARQQIEAFDSSEYVVTPSGSCAGMIRHYYPELFRDEPAWRERAQKLVEKTYEFTQFLVHVLGVRDLGAEFPHRVTYHPSCHGSRLLGITDEPLTLLGNVKGLKLLELPKKEDCCGFGGTFAVKMADMSEAMVREKAEHVTETGAEVLAGIDMGCLMNIGGRLSREGRPVRVLHVAELLWEGVNRRESASERS